MGTEASKSTNTTKSTKLKSTYFVPEFLISVEANSADEAYKLAKEQSRKTGKGDEVNG